MACLRNELSEAEIIEQARVLDAEVVSLVDALEAFYGNGFSDDSAGDVEYLDGHCYRVHRWLVWTDSQGFSDVSTFDTEVEAQAEIERYAVFCDSGDFDPFEEGI